MYDKESVISKVAVPILSEMFAIFFEMLCLTFSCNDELIEGMYSWQTCWFKAISSHEITLYETGDRCFSNSLGREFQNLPQHSAYIDKMWMSQEHIYYRPGYNFFYYLASVMALTMFRKKDSHTFMSALVDEIISNMNKMCVTQAISQILSLLYADSN